MPTIRPLNLDDFWVRTFDTGQTSQTPGQVLNTIVTRTGGLTTPGLAYTLSAVANAVTWFAVGNGSGTPAVGDTALFAELARTPLLLTDSSGPLPIVQAVFAAVAALGSWTEFGVFGGAASATANSGTLLAHLMLRPAFPKTATKVTTLQWSGQ